MIEALKKSLKGKNFFTLEVTPPHGVGISSVIEKLEGTKLTDKINAFIVTDNPLARLKSNSIVTASKLQEHFKKPSIATITMRDRNKIALQADILGASELDIRAILALTGDSAAGSDQPKVKGVFEANSQLLLEIIKCFNAGLDYSGKPFAYPPKPILSFAVCNAKANHPRTLQKKIALKLRFAPTAIITQPVYDLDTAKTIKGLFLGAQDEVEVTGTELIFGFFPVTKLRTAQFLNSHVPGVYIPEVWMSKLLAAKKISEEEEFRVGFELSHKALRELKNFHPKIHIMGANNFALLDKLLS